MTDNDQAQSQPGSTAQLPADAKVAAIATPIAADAHPAGVDGTCDFRTTLIYADYAPGDESGTVDDAFG